MKQMTIITTWFKLIMIEWYTLYVYFLLTPLHTPRRIPAPFPIALTKFQQFYFATDNCLFKYKKHMSSTYDS